MRGHLDSLGCGGDNAEDAGRGRWEASACGGRGHRRGNAVANECCAQRVTAGSPMWLNGSGAALFRPLLRDFPSPFFLAGKKFLHDSVAIPVRVILPLS